MRHQSPENSSVEVQVVIGIVALISLFLLRLFAVGRVAARQGQFVWLVFIPTLLIGVAMLWVSIQVFARDPFLGALVAVIAVIYLVTLVRFLRGMSRSVSSSAPEEDLVTAITEPFAEYVGTTVALGLIAGVIALFGLLIWGVIRAAS